MTLRQLSTLILALLVAAVANGQDLTLTTWNTCWCFHPDSRSRVSTTERPQTNDEYATKISFLQKTIATLSPNIVHLQEMAGSTELQDLTQSLVTVFPNATGRFAKGTDTFTGQNVATVILNPGPWKAGTSGRIPDLERIISKHLSLTLTAGPRTMKLLNIHLIRPMHAQREKHVAQLAAIHEYVSRQAAQEPNTGWIVAGDFNDSDADALPAASWTDVLALQPERTLIRGRQRIDRVFTSPNLELLHAHTGTQNETPAPDHPNDLWIRTHSDHLPVTCTVRFRQ